MISRVSELKSVWPSVTLMATKEKLKFGYQIGRGLGAVGHGKACLVELLDNKGGFGLGYDPSDKELFQAFRGTKGSALAKECLFPTSGSLFQLRLTSSNQK